MRISRNLNCQSCITYNIRNEYDQESNYSKVKGIHITQIRLQDLVEIIYPLVDPKNDLTNPVIRTGFAGLNETQRRQLGKNMLIMRYCIHRILTHLELYRTLHWKYRIGNDYFGQEIEGIYLKPEISNKLDYYLAILMRLTDNHSRIEQILQMQFGHLIESVQNKDWNIISVNVNQLQFSNIERLTKCRKMTKEGQLDYLDGYRLPRAIALKDPVTQKYRVVDGYHRICAAEHEQFLIIYSDGETT